MYFIPTDRGLNLVEGLRVVGEGDLQPARHVRHHVVHAHEDDGRQRDLRHHQHQHEDGELET